MPVNHSAYTYRLATILRELCAILGYDEAAAFVGQAAMSIGQDVAAAERSVEKARHDFAVELLSADCGCSCEQV